MVGCYDENGRIVGVASQCVVIFVSPFAEDAVASPYSGQLWGFLTRCYSPHNARPGGEYMPE